MKSIRIFHLKIYPFLVVKISIYLNKHVFIMRQHIETCFLFFSQKGLNSLCKLSPKETGDMSNVMLSGKIRKMSQFVVL